MNSSPKDIQEYEKLYRDLLYKNIEEITSTQTETLTQIKNTGKYVDIDTDLPNIVITFNNKLSELYQIFKKAGISMFAELNGKTGVIGPNFVGEAIIAYIRSQLSKGIDTLTEYNSCIGGITNKKIEKIRQIENAGRVKKFFLKIRSLFIPDIVAHIAEYEQDEIKQINSYLLKYKEIDGEIWNYNLRKNVVKSLVRFITNKQYSKEEIQELLKECVSPTLQKLGLDDLIPELKDDLSKTYERENPLRDKSWELPTSKRLEIQLSAGQAINNINTNNDNNQIQEKEYNEE